MAVPPRAVWRSVVQCRAGWRFVNKTVEETLEQPVEEEEDVEREYLPDGSILTRRTTHDQDGNKVIRETIEKAPQA